MLLGSHVDIKTGSTYKIGRDSVEFGNIRAYFVVGKSSNRLGILENLGVAVGIAFLTCSQPNLLSTSGFDVVMLNSIPRVHISISGSVPFEQASSKT